MAGACCPLSVALIGFLRYPNHFKSQNSKLSSGSPSDETAILHPVSTEAEIYK